MNVPTKPHPTVDRARAHLHRCHPMPTTSTATDAKCAKSCDGVCSEAANGCASGLPVWQRLVESRLQSSSTQKPPANGSEATEASQGIGAKHCTRCSVGQGKRNCECFEPMTFDRAALRIVLGGLALFWVAVIVFVGLKGCAS